MAAIPTLNSMKFLLAQNGASIDVRHQGKPVTEKVHQYLMGKENLYFLYRFIILPWELEWVDKRFLMKEGSLDAYCHNHKISIKSFESADKLNAAITEKYEEEEKEMAGMFWFVRKDTKPKDILRHLRNSFAHGNFQKRQKNKKQCLVIENIDSGRVKAKGFLPIDKLKELIGAASGCGV